MENAKMADAKLFDTKQLVMLLKKADKAEFPFAFGQGASPEKSVLLLHRKLNGKKLFMEIKNAKKDIKKGTFGIAKTDGKTLELKLDKELPGAKNHIKKYLKAIPDIKQNKLVILDSSGKELADEEAPAAAKGQAKDPAATNMKKQVDGIRKAVRGWDAITDAANKELDKLKKAIAALKNPVATAVAKGLDQIMDRLDRMDDEAEAALKAADSGDAKAFENARKKLLAKIDKLRNYVNTDELVRDADENPVTKIKLRDTLNSSLKELTTAMG